MSNSEMHHRKGSDCKYCKAREIRIRELEELDSRWRPPWTAPTDGTAICLWGVPRSGIARWSDHEGAWVLEVEANVIQSESAVGWIPVHPDWDSES